MIYSFSKILDLHPNLTKKGFEDINSPNFKNNRLELENSYSDFLDWNEFFYNFSKINSFNRNRGSLYFSLCFQRHFKKILPQGIIIAAAISEGFKYRKSYDGTVCFNVSTKSINRYLREKNILLSSPYIFN